MTPADDWFAAKAKETPLHRAALARLLGASDLYAQHPFAPMRTADGWQLGVAMEPPPCLDVDAVLLWQPGGDIVTVDPDTGKASLVGDDNGWIVGDFPFGDTVTLYTNGLAFARAWAAKRQHWLDLHRHRTVPGLAVSEPLDHGLPGLLLAGPLRTVCSWLPLIDRDRVTVDDPAMVRPLAAALLRAKRVPIVEALAPHNRKVAA